MTLKLLMLAGAMAPTLAFGAARAVERHSDMVVAEAQQTPADADKNKKKPPEKQPKPPVQQQQKPPGQQQTIKPVIQQKPAQLQQQQQQQQMKKLPPPSGNAIPQKPVQMQKPVQQQIPAVQQKPAFDKTKTPVVQTPQKSPVVTKTLHIEAIRGQRQETHEGNRTVFREQDRTIIREGGHTIIRHDDTERFRLGAREVHVERRGSDTMTVIVRPDGSRIITVVDAGGRLLRRTRRLPDGREVILIDNSYRGPGFGFIAGLAAPVVHIPRERYIVDADRADPDLLYETMIAAPIMHVDRRYSLDEIRYTRNLRDWMPSIDLDTITFDTGSWEVTPDQARLLEPIAAAMRRAIARNPDEIYLIEGHTDAVGSDLDNLSLSDRRAESVAEILTQDFGIPPDNLTTQGYGEQFLKIPTQGPERRNRRVTVRRITPLLTGQN